MVKKLKNTWQTILLLQLVQDQKNYHLYHRMAKMLLVIKTSFRKTTKKLFYWFRAIEFEFAYFYNAMGTEVVIVNTNGRILPVEDEEVSKQLGAHLKK